MKFPHYIAKRYLFAKSGNNAINIITIIATFGVIVGSLALFIILSGFSGLRTFSYSLLDASDPDLKITSIKGKTFLFTDDEQQVLLNNSNITTFSKVVEERVFLQYNNKQHIAYIKGVDDKYNEVVAIDSVLNVGTWLDSEFQNTAVIGNGISYKLSLGILNFGEPLTISVPKPGKGFINPATAFRSVKTQIIGVYGGSEEFQNKYVFTEINTAQELLRYDKNQLTGIEIRLNNALLSKDVQEELQLKLGNSLKVETREQLNELYYKVINSENFISYLIFTLIVIIALFNVIGAVIMMIIDKRKNLKTLANLGATVKEIKQIFVTQGFLLTLFGMAIGLFIGVVLVLLQKEFGFFMITQNLPYPVDFKWFNLFVVIATISVLGFIAAKIASSRISANFIEK
ncbi:ABC transporter permease [Tenacibaculum sp. 1_MG-2023]|uniref:ABC transporter permease n=1 Tax=Tenacibaculum sp. 1_MG-2023 TaxID=3062653 RepID=UPI0034A48CD7